MIKVTLVNRPTISPIALAEYAAKTCYQPEMPELKQSAEQSTINFVNNRLFKTGHHTTLQHQFFGFAIEDIAISDVTFGLHLASPFYNSDQRSGRFCGQMFTNPDYEWIENYIKFFWPNVKKVDRQKVLNYAKSGINIYQKYIGRATELAKILMREERPYLSEANIELNAPKIAQEQMRVFIPTIMPTALVFTINLSTLVAMWESAWTPVLRFVTDEMRQRVMTIYPELDFMFIESRRNTDDLTQEQIDWAPEFTGTKDEFLGKPICNLQHVHGESDLENPRANYMQPLDLLHYFPEFMQNSISEVRLKVAVSVATMGQDQRHRTVRRGPPKFTQGFYCPPLVTRLLQESDKKFFGTWAHGLNVSLPATLHTAIAPYGAMVEYMKVASFNALLHEQAKRLCWCAQEEIYHLSRDLRTQLIDRLYDGHDLPEALIPPCRDTGRCAEGDRYCGRDIKDAEDFFPERRI